MLPLTVLQPRWISYFQLHSRFLSSVYYSSVLAETAMQCRFVTTILLLSYWKTWAVSCIVDVYQSVVPKANLRKPQNYRLLVRLRTW